MASAPGPEPPAVGMRRYAGMVNSMACGGVFEPRNILVTGGCGFTGANFVRYVARNHPHVHITVLDKLTYAGNPENIAGLPPSQVDLVVGDICDVALLERIVPGHDAIIHFAEESHKDNSIANSEPFIRTNVEGTMRLLEAARKHDVRFHHISTGENVRDRPGHDRRYAIDTSKLRAELGGTPRLVGAGQGGHRGPLPRARAVKRRLLQAALPRQSDVAQQTLHGLKHHGIGNHRK